MENKYQELSKESIQSIANEFFEDKFHLIEAQDKPKAIFIAGQSGAGKTQAANLVKAELKDNGGYVPVDADRMREKLPTGGIAYPSEQTQKDAGALVSVLRKRLIQERINFFEEGTFRDSESVKQGLVFLKSQGYQVEMVAVATSFEKSLLGIHERYERQLSSGASNPRLVPADYHQKAFDGFTNTFQKTAHFNSKEDSYVCESYCNNSWYITFNSDNQINIYGRPENYSYSKSIYFLEFYGTCWYVGIR